MLLACRVHFPITQKPNLCHWLVTIATKLKNLSEVVRNIVIWNESNTITWEKLCRYLLQLPFQTPLHILTRLQEHCKYQHIRKNILSFVYHEEHCQSQEKTFYFLWLQLIQEPALCYSKQILIRLEYIPSEQEKEKSSRKMQ